MVCSSGLAKAHWPAATKAPAATAATAARPLSAEGGAGSRCAPPLRERLSRAGMTFGAAGSADSAAGSSSSRQASPPPLQAPPSDQVSPSVQLCSDHSGVQPLLSLSAQASPSDQEALSCQA